MSENDGLPKRIGTTINEMDIDFSSFTIAGWIVVLATLTTGPLAGWWIYHAVPMRNAMDRGPALAAGVGGFVVSLVAFLSLRRLFRYFAIAIVKADDDDGVAA
ncbi:MAG: hypothetical protein R3C05_01825 [Pirellulaceae bacterium]